MIAVAGRTKSSVVRITVRKYLLYIYVPRQICVKCKFFQNFFYSNVRYKIHFIFCRDKCKFRSNSIKPCFPASCKRMRAGTRRQDYCIFLWLRRNGTIGRVATLVGIGIRRFPLSFPLASVKHTSAAVHLAPL